MFGLTSVKTADSVIQFSDNIEIVGAILLTPTLLWVSTQRQLSNIVSSFTFFQAYPFIYGPFYSHFCYFCSSVVEV